MEMKNTGGCAFPQDLISMDGIRTSEGGMTLRDYFAAKALQALIMVAQGMATKTDESITEAVLADQAYYFSDAMLAERAK